MDTELMLIDPDVVRDHLDLIIPPDERGTYGLWFALCDADARPIVHAAVDDVPPDPPPAMCEQVVTPFAMALSEGDDSTMLVAVTRPGNSDIGPVDQRWFHAVHDVCQRLGVTVLGVYLVTPHDIVPIHLDDAPTAVHG